MDYRLRVARTALILGGTGQIGRAAASRLAEAGWDVTLAARNEPDAPAFPFLRIDRDESLDPPGEFDGLVDVVAYGREHAEQVLRLGGRIGTVVAISSASVYADEEGRTLDEATDEDSFPHLPVPIPETQPTTEASDATYSTGKVAMERALLEQAALPATVLRPCAIHGPGGSLTREWYFVKRILDRRRAVLLADRGESRFHTTSVANLAELIRLALERPGTRVLNCGDPDPPNVLGICRAVAGALGHEWVECLLPRTPWERGQPLGNPWRAPRPLVVDMTAAENELGYRPVVSYEEAVVETCRWLVDEHPSLGEYMERFFDYAAEDAYLAGLS